MMHIAQWIVFDLFSFSGGIDHIFRYTIHKYNFFPRHETLSFYILKMGAMTRKSRINMSLFKVRTF